MAVAALLFCAELVIFAQSAENGSLAGKLTDLHSTPLDGATVVVRNQATGAEARTTTTRNGNYRFIGLDAGEYTLEAESPRLGRGRVGGILVIAGHEARVQTAIEFEQPTAEPVQAEIHTIAPAIHAVAATPPAVPNAEPAPSQLLSALQQMLRPARETPATVTPPVNATLSTESLQTLSLSGHPLQVSEPPPPASTATAADGAAQARSAGQELAAVRENGAIAGVAAVGQGAAVPGAVTQLVALRASAGLSGLAIGEAAAGAVRAAIEFARPRPIVAAVHDTDPVAPVVTTTLPAEQLQVLPMSGRRWQEFTLDTPMASTAAGGESPTSLRGAGGQPAATTVDGASRTLAFGGVNGSGRGSPGQSGTGQGWAWGRGSAIGESAIREVQLAAGNVEAQAGRAAGGRMNLETRRGANGLHGQGFLFDRQNDWGARNPFTRWIQETAKATELTLPVFTAEAYSPPDRELTWGIGLGRHIRRDKLFWFAALDGYQRNDPGVATVKHSDVFFPQSGVCVTTGCPTDSQLEMIATRLGPSNNPLAAGIKAFSGILETLDQQMLGPAPRTAAQWVGFGRVDWEAGERHRFTLEGTGARWDGPGGGLTRISETYGSHSFGTSHASEEWLLARWEAFLTPNLLAVTQASAGRDILSARPSTPSLFEQSFLSQNAWGQLPQIVVDSRYGFTIGNPSRFGTGSYPDERLYQGQEKVDYVRGGLLVKVGFDMAHNSDATSLLRNQTGTYTYANALNLASDALVFQDPSLRSDPLDPFNPHNCDQTGKGFGALPCYSYYSQTMGPSNWQLSTNDWAGYATAQWQPGKRMVLSAGMRWEREQLPPPIAALVNPDISGTSKLPSLGNNWGPRVSLALGSAEGHWPVLRLGYGMYFGRTENSTVETGLTQTGSPKGDLNFFMRPTDDLYGNSGGAPPFPYVFAGEPTTMVKPGAVEFAPGFRNPEVHQGVVALEERLPGRVELTASAVVSLGRRLPISIDNNIDLAAQPQTITYAVKPGTGAAKGPIQDAQITVPFYSARLNRNYQQITAMSDRANSTYEAAMLKATRYGRRGLSLHAHYTYAHAMDWNPNESTQVAGSDALDPNPANFRQEYGTSNLDVRHSAAAMVMWEAPWKLRNWAGRVANGWMLSGIGQFHSGLPYTMRTAGSLSGAFEKTVNGSALIEALAPGMNGSGGDNRVYGVGRNTFRYPSTWKADLRFGRRFNLGQMRELELLAESFNLFNHQNVTELETTGYYIGRSSSAGELPTLNFLTGAKPDTTAFGQPLNINATNFYRERQIQIGLRMRF